MPDRMVVITAEMRDHRRFKRVMSLQCKLPEGSTPEDAITAVYPHHTLIKLIDVSEVVKGEKQ